MSDFRKNAEFVNDSLVNLAFFLAECRKNICKFFVNKCEEDFSTRFSTKR